MVTCPVDHLCDTRCAVAVVAVFETPDADAYLSVTIAPVDAV